LGGLVQLLFEQHVELEMQVEPHSISPDGQAQPPALQISPPVHAGAPLQVHVPLVHVLVVELAQSLLVQQSPDGMHAPSHACVPSGHAQPAPVQTRPPEQAIAPLHVQTPSLHVLVVEVEHWPFVQHSPVGMQALPQAV
jgi:hypothetical protein